MSRSSDKNSLTHISYKSDIRNNIKKMRNGMSPDSCFEKSRAIAAALLNTTLYKAHMNILLYMAVNHEVDTSMIFEKAVSDGKRVYFPKVYGKEMQFIKVSSMDEFEEGSYGILEPISDAAADIKEGLIVMPGVAFDKNCNRIGYGGGFYDRYMEKHRELVSCAVCYECQIVEDIPSEPHDIKPDMVITEDRIFSPGYMKS